MNFMEKSVENLVKEAKKWLSGNEGCSQCRYPDSGYCLILDEEEKEAWPKCPVKALRAAIAAVEDGE